MGYETMSKIHLQQSLNVTYKTAEKALEKGESAIFESAMKRVYEIETLLKAKER